MFHCKAVTSVGPVCQVSLYFCHYLPRLLGSVKPPKQLHAARPLDLAVRILPRR